MWSSKYQYLGNEGTRPMWTITSLLGLAVASLSAVHASSPCVPHWDNAIGQPGMDGFFVANPVFDFATFDDGSGSALYAGGNFAEAGGVEVNHVAKWDGSQWSALDGGLSAWARALAVFDDGSGPALYVGGQFSEAGGVAANRIARWDGHEWSALGTGMNATVLALMVFDDGSGPALYAGGDFTEAGGIPASHIARWDGQQWSPLGSGISNTVRTMAVFNDGAGTSLYVGGSFAQPGSRMARWNGETWSDVGGGVNHHVFSLTVYESDLGPALYAGGTFSEAGGVPVNRIARWNGQQWSPLLNGIGGESVDETPGVHALSAFDDGGGPALYVGGDFTEAGNVAANFIARWNGQHWAAVGDGMDTLFSNSAVTALEVFDEISIDGSALAVGGHFDVAGGLPANQVALWIGCTPFNAEPGWHNPPEPVDYDPPAPPDAKQDKLIVVTHGWNTAVSTNPDGSPNPDSQFNLFWKPFASTLEAQVGSDWKVHAYDWTADSGHFPPIGHANDANAALAKAFHTHGPALGATIASHEYSHVHLIGHSAGSGLVASAAGVVRQLSPETTIHTTFLDAFAGMAGGMDAQAMYGSHADWSDHYFSQEKFVVCAGTGPYTQLHLTQAFNLDVSLVDPNFTDQCLSSHAWPSCFYHYSIDGSLSGDCDPAAGPTLGFGFPLSFAEWAGDIESWLTYVNSTYPPGELEELPGSALGGSDKLDDDLVWRVRQDPLLDLDSLPAVVSDEESVVVTDGVLTMTTHPKETAESSVAWVNFQVEIASPVNFITFELEFTGGDPEEDTASLMTLYVNGVDRGVVDEVYAPEGPVTYVMPTPGELDAGTHIVSFRLDLFSDEISSINIMDVATGWGGFANIADLNGDGVVDGADLLILLSAWGKCSEPDDCPADLNGDGVVDGADLLILLSNWG